MLVPADTIGTLIVFDILLMTLLAVAAQTLRIRLAAVPEEAEIMTRQLQSALQEAERLRMSNVEAERVSAELEPKVAEQETLLAAAQHRFAEARNRAPATVYVLEQLIQPSQCPWMIMIQRGDPAQAPPGSIEADWAAGRRFIAYADDAASARRRIEARFRPEQGYRATAPQRFSMS